MLASQGAESCIIGLAITAGIDLSPWAGVGCLNRPISLDRFLDLSDLLEIQ